MTKYILINNKDRVDFEKYYQLPYGCYNTSIYDNPKEAIRLLNNMCKSDKVNYWVEKWVDGEFSEVVIKGDWLE